MYNTAPAWTLSAKSTSFSDQMHKVSQTNHLPQQHTPPKGGNSGEVQHGSIGLNNKRLGNEKKLKYNKQNIPGPGQYHLNCSTKSKKMGKFGTQKYQIFQPRPGPSPSHYHPKFSTTQLTNPSHSFCFGQKTKKKESNPGPGAYLNVNSSGFLSKGVKIERQKRFITPCHETPGPGTYEMRKDLNKNGLNFSKQKKMKSSTIHCHEPGPGAYLDFFKTSSSINRGFTMTGKSTEKMEERKPGPACYSPQQSKISDGPKFTMNGKDYTYEKEKSPGPARYTPKKIHSSAAHSIGRAEKPSDTRNQFIPGPGTYNEMFLGKASPKYSMRSSGRKTLIDEKPGPNVYYPNERFLKPRPKSAKIGTEKRNKTIHSTTPGPGEYNPKKYYDRKKTTQTYSFNRDQKLKYAKSTTPGPADYDIPNTIGTNSTKLK